MKRKKEREKGKGQRARRRKYRKIKTWRKTVKRKRRAEPVGGMKKDESTTSAQG